MRCRQCGAEARDNWLVCPYCSTKLVLLDEGAQRTIRLDTSASSIEDESRRNPKPPTMPADPIVANEGLGSGLALGTFRGVSAPPPGGVVGTSKFLGGLEPSVEHLSGLAPSDKGPAAHLNVIDSVIGGGIRQSANADKPTTDLSQSIVVGGDAIVSGGIKQSGSGSAISLANAPSIALSGDAIVSGGIHQTILFGDQEYILYPFPNNERFIFPRFKAQAKNGHTLVAKGLGELPEADEISMAVESMRLGNTSAVITPFRGCQVMQGQAYLMREYCVGESLADFVTKNGPIAERDAVRLLIRITEVLDKRLREAHGSLSPNNVFLKSAAAGVSIVLTDWGIDALKDILIGLKPALKHSITKWRASNPFLASTNQLVEKHKRDSYSLGIITCFLMGMELDRLYAPPLDDGWQQYRARFGSSPRQPLLRVARDLIEGRLFLVPAILSRLRDV